MAKGDIISRLKLESGEFDSKIKRAGQELLAYSDHCKKIGLQMGFANRDAKEFAKQLGSMATTSNTARGKINELSEAFVNLKVMYKNMTDEEKKNQFGKNLAISLDQLKGRIDAAKQDLADATKELSGGGGNSGGFNGALSSLASKLGVNSELMGVLTTGTMGYTAAITAGAGAVAYATREWAAFNDELAKQKQITGVTTGLTGGDADALTAAARSMSKVYGTDFREVINAANVLINQFGASGEEAIQLLRDGMQGMIQGDGPKLLNMIQQYAPAFQSAGVSASQLVAVIQNSEGGLFTDQNMQAIIMGLDKIRNMTNGTAEALRAVGIDADGMKEKMRNGSMTVFEALQEVGMAIDNNKGKTEEVGAVMREVFGRQARTAGDNLGRAIAELNTNLDETKTQTGEVGESLKELNLKTEEFERKLMDVFGMNGWDTMNNEIKTGLLVSLTETLGRLEDIFHMLNGISRIDLSTSGAAKFFMDLTTYAYEALNPILGLLDAVSQIYKYFNGGSTGGTEDKLYNGGTIGDVVVTANRPRKTPRGGGGGGTITPRGGRNTKIEEIVPVGSIKDLSNQLQALQKEQQLVTDAEGWQKYQQQIDDLTKRIDQLKGKVDEVDFDKLFPFKSIANGSTMSIGESMAASITQDLAMGIQQADVTALRSIMQVVIANGLEGIDIPTESLMEQIFGDGADIPDDVWQKFIDQINEKLKEKGIDPIQLDFSTGKTGKKKEEKEEKKYLSEGLSKLGGGLGGLQSGFEQLGIDLGDGFKDVVNGIQGISTILSAIMTIVSAIEVIAGTDALIPFANGGVVHAANGWSGVVPGTSFSGDNVPILANSGEIVLNASQQSNLAQNLQGSGGGSVHVTGILRGEDIVLIADRWGRRTGKGELLFGKNL